MRSRIVKDLACPNSGLTGFHMVALDVLRNGSVVSLAQGEPVAADDDIKTGLVINRQAGTVYPIVEYVLSILTDEDVDRDLYTQHLTDMQQHVSESVRELVRANLERLARCEGGRDGRWNQEEMVYYDREVASEGLRSEFRDRIRSQPLWHIFIERQEHLLSRVKLESQLKVLEVGCGNARTIACNAPPSECGYAYVGTDISLKRLMLAKSVLPEGDFLQASAFSLPFQREVFDVAIAFGVLHHLPNPEQGLMEAMGKLRSEGLFLIHEPIEKRPLVADEAIPAVWKAFRGYEHSDHDNEVSLNQFLDCLDQNGHRVVYSHMSGSIMRTLLTSGPMSKVPFFRRRWWWNAILGIDRLFVATLCRRPGPFGPNSAFLVVAK